MTLRISLDVYEMTYGQLFDFTDAARAAGVDRSSQVVQVPAEQDENIIDRFDLEVTQLPRQGVTISAEDAETHVDTLQSVIDRDGDARNEMTALIELLKALRG